MSIQNSGHQETISAGCLLLGHAKSHFPEWQDSHISEWRFLCFWKAHRPDVSMGVATEFRSDTLRIAPTRFNARTALPWPGGGPLSVLKLAEPAFAMIRWITEGIPMVQYGLFGTGRDCLRRDCATRRMGLREFRPCCAENQFVDRTSSSTGLCRKRSRKHSDAKIPV